MQQTHSIGLTHRIYFEFSQHFPIYTQHIMSIQYARETSDICSAYGEYNVHTWYRNCTYIAYMFNFSFLGVKIQSAMMFQNISYVSHMLYARRQNVTGP